MRIATWNVNSIKTRLPLVLDWLKREQPDALLLQEIKCENDAFPALEIQAAGYHFLAKGMKAYHGVALLSKQPSGLRADVLPGDDADAQARYVEAELDGFIIASIYLPNGNPLGTDKFTYKLGWMERLNRRAARLLKEEKPVVLAGDYNVIPEPVDARHPERWTNDALFQPQSRAAFRALLNMGYYDAFRLKHAGDTHAYTFWDYQNNAFDTDDGIRIDHLLLSPEAADRLKSCRIAKDERAKAKASDHVPVVAEF